MIKRFTTMRDLNRSMAQALNMIDPTVENHHEMTAYLAHMIGRAAGFDGQALQLGRLAALTHDIGFITSDEPKSIEELESNAKKLAEVGAEMIRDFPGNAGVADIVRYCQSSWALFLSFTDREKEERYPSARVATVVHLADVVATLVRSDVPILNQVKSIRETVKQLRGIEFSEEAVDAFLRVGENEYVWMDLRYNPQFLDYYVGDIEDVSLDGAASMTTIMSRIIDYRSSFTAMHSSGVAASAVALARLAGMDEDECKMMAIAGHLHDIGKLKVPRAILEKPGRLTEEEFNVIKEHPYYTRLNLMNVKGFDRIADWAGFHHEKLNGRGYPFHLGAGDLDTGARIMAVADVFSAITEMRPYRAGMDRGQAMQVLQENVRSGGIDGDTVALLHDHYEEIDRLREETSQKEGARYYQAISRKNP